MDLKFLIFSRQFNHKHKDQFKKFQEKKHTNLQEMKS